jgi:hypothetical protein
VIRAKVTLGESPLQERQSIKQVPTLAQFNEERYLPYIKGYKKSWVGDEGNFRNHILPRFGSKHLDEITHQQVVEFHQQVLAKGLAKATCNRLLILLRYMFNLAIKWETPGIIKNPTAGFPLMPEDNRRERFLTTEEAQILYEKLKLSANTMLQYIVPMLCNCHIRLGF